ncbi:Hint domain-containing protein [Pseudaestuariivita atlantica]|uniref:Hint domain-containing protein n=1 Tax=Pseudaestuariivita atlantica TaxID=1317121 RepID=UPI00067BE38E|nr:Hint domain-containing protein [Pseudaestuariivita atlantica]
MPNFSGDFYVAVGSTPSSSLTFYSDANGFGSESILIDDDGTLDSGDVNIAQISALGGNRDILELNTATYSIGGNVYSVWTAHISTGPQDFLIMGQVGGGTIPEIDAVPSGTSAGTFTNIQPITASGVTATCFLPGSLIATPDGEVPVETLKIGDLICTADGGATPVKWLGRQTVTTFNGVAERNSPVRIAAGALGLGLPHSDLTVTADHGMVVDGYVINASALVNHSTITYVPIAEMGAAFTVYHVETEAHDVILANGAPAETFIDYVGRAAFDNHDEYLALYGAERIIPELPQPRISSARLVPQVIRERLGIADAPHLLTA